MAKNQAWLSTSVTVSLPNRSVYRTEAARGNTLTYFDPSTMLSAISSLTTLPENLA